MKAVLVGGLLVLALGGLTACGESQEAAGNESEAEAPAAAAAREALEPALETPPMTVTEKLDEPPAEGETFVFAMCGTTACSQIGEAFKEATAALNWDYKQIPFDPANPATLIDALQQALRYDPIAVSLASQPYVNWEKMVPEYEKAGVWLLPQHAGVLEPSPAIIANLGGPEYWGMLGQKLAEWFIWDSNAAGKGLIVTAPAFGILASATETIESTTQAECPDCALSMLEVTIPQYQQNKIAPLIVSELQRNPDIKYVLTTNSPFVQGLPAALRAAGLDDIKVAGIDANKVNQTDLKTGAADAFMAGNLIYGAWQALDTTLRKMQGMTFDEAPPLPNMLLLESNVGTPSDELDEPAGYEEEFKALWGIG